MNTPTENNPVEPADEAARCAAIRSRVEQTVKSDVHAALEMARSIPLPWYRAQSLAIAAAHAAPQVRQDILCEAMKAAASDRDLFRTVGSSAWVLRHLSNASLDLRPHLVSVLALLPKVQPDTSRAAAASMLIDAAIPVDLDIARDAARIGTDGAYLLKQADGRSTRKWGQSYAKRLIEKVWSFDRELAEQLLTADPNQAQANNLRRALR